MCVQIKETRRSLKDSESGLEKMSIAHHIQDRGHVIERKENRKTGEKELNQDFQNMDESEEAFKETNTSFSAGANAFSACSLTVFFYCTNKYSFY